MTTVRNAGLADRISELGLTRAEVADQVNAAIEQHTGAPGETSERWVDYLLSGAILWPRPRQRNALEQVLSASAVDLGFIPPAGNRRRSRPTLQPAPPVKGDPPMDRRAFLLGAGAGSLTLTLPTVAAGTRLGMSDVQALRAPLVTLRNVDHSRGGTSLAPPAAAVAQRIEHAIAHGHTSSRVQRALYGLTGEYLADAGWYAIDAGDLIAAGRYLDHSLRVAIIAQNPLLQAQIWNFLAWIADLQSNPTEMMAIAQAALTSTAARQNPKVTALWHGWVAQGHAFAGHTRLTDRSLERAHTALDRATPDTPTPPWLEFLDHAEINSQATYSHLTLGNYTVAAATATNALTATPDRFPRNRISRQIMLANAHLGNRDIEQSTAIATAALNQRTSVHSGRLLNRYRALERRYTAWKAVPAAATWIDQFRAHTRVAT